MSARLVVGFCHCSETVKRRLSTNNQGHSQQTFTCSMSTIETQEKGVKLIES